MEGNRQVSGKRTSSGRHDLHRAGIRHRQARLVLRRVSGEGLRMEIKEGTGIKRISVQVRKSGGQMVVGKGNYLGIGQKELRKIESMALKVMPHRCLGGGGYSDGPGNRLNRRGNEKSGFRKNIGKVQ